MRVQFHDDDDECSLSTVSTYNGHYYAEEFVRIEDASDVGIITNRILMGVFSLTGVGVQTNNTHNEHPIFTVENWIRLGQAVGQSMRITEFRIYAADSNYYDPIRSTLIQDLFCDALAQNRSIQVLHTEGLEYSTGQIRIMRPFFSQSEGLTEIIFRGSDLRPGTIDELTEAIKERGGNAKTIRLIEYSSLSVANINQILAIIELAKECTHLTTLTLTHPFRSGFCLCSCRAIASFLASKNCMLKRLLLDGSRIKDDGCKVIARSLRHNRRLKWLYANDCGISDQGLASFTTAVCDTSSIESTLDSNHTLEGIIAGNFGSFKYVPATLATLLRLNKDRDKAATANLKVLRCHFSHGFDLTAAGLDAKILPYLLEWLGRLPNTYLRSECADPDDEATCRSAFFRIIKHNSYLCSYPSYDRVMRHRAEDQVAKLGRELSKAQSRIETLERELEKARSKRRKRRRKHVKNR